MSPSTRRRLVPAVAFASSLVAAAGLSAAEHAGSARDGGTAPQRSGLAAYLSFQPEAAAGGQDTSEAGVVIDEAGKEEPGPIDDEAGEFAPLRAGYDGQFVLRSGEKDPRFVLSPYVELQFRHITNFGPFETRDDLFVTPGGGLTADPALAATGPGGAPVSAGPQQVPTGDAFDDVDFGFEVRRARFGFRGNAYSPDLKYNIRVALGRNAALDEGSEIALENAYVEYAPEGGLFGYERTGFRIGQFRDPSFYVESTAMSRMLAVERSLANEVIGGQIDFVQGVRFFYSGDRVEASASYLDGLDSDNTNFLDQFTEYQAGLSGRIDFLLLGNDASVFRDFTALETEEPSLRAGAGCFLDLAEGLGPDGQGDDLRLRFLHTADIQYETANGLGLFAAYYADLFDTPAGDGYNLGGEVKAAQVLDKEAGWEIFGRYSFVLFDDPGTFITVDGDVAAAEDLFHEVTVGVNKYFEIHRVKVTVDVGYLPVGNPGSFSGAGYRNDGDSDEGQLSIRGQFQVLL